jgi:hypothetical protein
MISWALDRAAPLPAKAQERLTERWLAAEDTD